MEDEKNSDKKMTPEISVIVPVYNAEKYLEKCFDSIRNQTFPDFEVLVIDDGSSDKSPAICDRYANLDARFKVVHQKNAGNGAARNLATAMAAGDWCFSVDADDWIEPDAFEILMKKADACSPSPEVIVFDFVFEYLSAGVSKFYKRMPEEKVFYTAADIKEWQIRTLAPVWYSNGSFHGTMWDGLGCARAVRRSIYDQGIRFGTDMPQMSDNLIFLEILEKIHTLLYVQKPCYHYRMNDVSITRSFSEKAEAKLIPYAAHLKTYIEENHLSDPVFIQGYYARMINIAEIILRNNYCNLANQTPVSQKVAGIKALFSRDPYQSAVQKMEMSFCDKNRKLLIKAVRSGAFGLVYFLFRFRLRKKTRGDS